MLPRLNVIIGSTRPGRVGPTIAQWFADFATAHGQFDVRLVDLADYALPLLDEATHPARRQYAHDHTRRWSESVGAADAFVFVTPEYDYFPPASLVNAVQTLLHEWAYKPAAIVSYGGVSGGLRASQALRQLLGNVNVMAIAQSVPVSFFPQFIGEEGGFRPNEVMADGATTLLNELAKWTGALKTMRAPAAA